MFPSGPDPVGEGGGPWCVGLAGPRVPAGCWGSDSAPRRELGPVRPLGGLAAAGSQGSPIRDGSSEAPLFPFRWTSDGVRAPMHTHCGGVVRKAHPRPQTQGVETSGSPRSKASGGGAHPPGRWCPFWFRQRPKDSRGGLELGVNSETAWVGFKPTPGSSGPTALDTILIALRLFLGL